MPHALAIAAHSPRVRAKRERRREEILRAALRAFREHGYHQTTLDDIATRLDVRKSALYHYFPDKESILYECHRESLGELERTWPRRAPCPHRASAFSTSSASTFAS